MFTNRRILAWAFYDWANSAFATTVMAGFFPLFFKQYWASGLSAPRSTFYLGLTNTIASLVVAATAMLLGRWSDNKNQARQLLFAFAISGAIATACLYFVMPGGWQLAACLYFLAVVCFAWNNQFCDTLLTTVAPANQQHRVSLFGYALGYLGGGLLFTLQAAMTIKPHFFGLADSASAIRLSFVLVGVWWVIFSLPGNLIIKTTSDTTTATAATSWRDWRHYLSNKSILYFLIAYWFYMDGVNTIIKMALDYGLALNLNNSALLTALLICQWVGFPATLLYNRLAVRVGVRPAIIIGLVIYLIVSLGAMHIRTATDFYALAIAIGCVQGGVQALSRSYFATLIPVEKAGEYFGLYNMVGKFAAILGPVLMGGVALISNNSRLSTLAVTLLVGLGMMGLIISPAVGAAKK